MSKNDLECVICFSAFDDAEHYPKTAQCGHLACETCVKKFARAVEPNLPFCPLCRAPIPANHLEWDLKTEIVEHVMVEKNENNRPPQARLLCTVCRRERPFDDFVCCLQCSPGLEQHLETGDLVTFFKKSVCEGCNQKHNIMHMTMNHQAPLEIPVNILYTGDQKFLTLTLLSLVNRFAVTDQWYKFAEKVAKSLLLNFLRRHPNLPRNDDSFDLLKKIPVLSHIMHKF